MAKPSGLLRQAGARCTTLRSQAHARRRLAPPPLPSLRVRAPAGPTAPTAPSTAPEVRKAVGRLLGDQAAAVERGDLDAWAAPLDRDVFLFESDPTEATFGRDAILVQLKKTAASRMRADVHRTY